MNHEKTRHWSGAPPAYAARAVRTPYERSTFAGDVVWFAMLIRPFDTWDCDEEARGGTPMEARSTTALTSALRRMRL